MALMTVSYRTVNALLDQVAPAQSQSLVAERLKNREYIILVFYLDAVLHSFHPAPNGRRLAHNGLGRHLSLCV